MQAISTSSNRAARYRRKAVASAQGCNALEVQARRTDQIVQKRGFVLVEDLVDDGLSGNSPERPGYKRLCELIEKQGVDAIVVTSLDRLARNTEEICKFVNKAAIKGVRIFIAGADDQGVELDATMVDLARRLERCAETGSRMRVYVRRSTSQKASDRSPSRSKASKASAP